MSFSEVIQDISFSAVAEEIASYTAADVERALGKEQKDINAYKVLLSPAATPYLEQMAQEARKKTMMHFGRGIVLFTPLYLSNYCVNHCVYCSFNCKNNILRKQLSFSEIETEMHAIAETGLKHLLILTGEAPKKATLSYLEESVHILKKSFSSIAIEVYPMDKESYKTLVQAGVDGLTLFQETYDKDLYSVIHPKGPKSDYKYRLNAPEEACRASIRTVTLGALLGLSTSWQAELYFLGLHTSYLQKKYPNSELGISMPRMRPYVGGYTLQSVMSDRDMVQALTAYRLFMPNSGITVSTRETASFRENILPLGVTKMSAGVQTAVGGHASSNEEQVPQFVISDDRSVADMAKMLKAKGYQPIYQDWQSF